MWSYDFLSVRLLNGVCYVLLSVPPGTIWRAIDLRHFCKASTFLHWTVLTTLSIFYENQTRQSRKIVEYFLPIKIVFSYSYSLIWLIMLCRGSESRWVQAGRFSKSKEIRKSWFRCPPQSSCAQLSDTCWILYLACSILPMVGSFVVFIE